MDLDAATRFVRLARWMLVTQKIIAGVDIGGTKTRIMACQGERTIADEVLVTETWRIRQMETDATTLGGIVDRKSVV